MKRGGFGKEVSDQPESAKFTPIRNVLHWVPRACIGVALTGGGIAGMFMWDWRYVAAGLLVTIGGLIVGPWIPPMPPYYVSVDPEWKPELGDDEVHL